MAGDLIIDKLGLSAADRAMVVAETDLVINCAASTNFDDPLLDALEINYFGCLRMVELATECKNLLCYTHVSTAYTNSNCTGHNFIEEKIYDLEGGKDPRELVAEIKRMDPKKVQETEMQIIGDYPNTYTFTKSLVEKTLKRLNTIPISIIRPSIIISCYKEPLRGWTDTLSAAGGLTYAVSIGLIKNIKAKATSIFDIIPCDYVTNLIIAQTVHHSTMRKTNLQVSHSSSGYLNPTSISFVTEILNDYATYN